MTIDKVKQGKRSRASGATFERKVRKDLESKGWIVDKWSNNVEFGVVGYTGNDGDIPLISKEKTKLIPAKHKFRGIGIPMTIGTGFPDFVCIRFVKKEKENISSKGIVTEFSVKETENVSKIKLLYEVIGCEVKTNGYLDKTEKEKCKWYLENKIFSKILIAKKIKVGRRVVVEYKELK